MRTTLFIAVFLLLAQSQGFAQSQDLPKFEVAGEFTTLEREVLFGEKRTDPGFGGRFTYKLNKTLSLEAAAHFFPKECFDCLGTGRATQVVGGVKAGKRFGSWGVFGKARPGFVYFSAGDIDPIVTCLNQLCPIPTAETRIKKYVFAADIGGVVEFYPSKRIVTRFDLGDTILRFTRRVTPGIRFEPSVNGFVPYSFIRPAQTTHGFQFIASVGFRF